MIQFLRNLFFRRWYSDWTECSSRFFITSSVLDLTIVWIDPPEVDSNSQQSHVLRAGSIPNIELGSLIYLLGYNHGKELMLGEGKVTVATDNLIKLSTALTFSPGSAGFDFHGNLAFMICDPMKLSSSPTSTRPSSSSGLEKKDIPSQFGIPIAVIVDWFYQHWEGSLDDVINLKSTLLRMRSTGQKSDLSFASLSMRRMFKDTATSSSSTVVNLGGVNPLGEIRSTTELYETPLVTSANLTRKNIQPPQLLDINFPPRHPKTVKQMPMEKSKVRPEKSTEVNQPCLPEEDCRSEVHSSCSPRAVFASPGDGLRCSSDGETMCSAETMESRNYSSPRRVGRSQSCMSYERFSDGAQTSAAAARRHYSAAVRNVCAHSQAQTMPVNQKSHIYDSPTVSSAMKNRVGGSEQRSRPRRMASQVSPRWMFWLKSFYYCSWLWFSLLIRLYNDIISWMRIPLEQISAI